MTESWWYAMLWLGRWEVHRKVGDDLWTGARRQYLKRARWIWRSRCEETARRMARLENERLVVATRRAKFQALEARLTE